MTTSRSVDRPLTPPTSAARLYSEFAEWWPLLSRPQDYAEEAASHWRLLSALATRPLRNVLELGCGGGNNATHLKQKCRLVLTDLSSQMLDVSRRANPECEHVQGDMRTLRLGRRFDAVFIHDAIMYLRTEKDLATALTRAFEHCEPGGVALFVPDCTRETWRSETGTGGHDDTDRALRYLQWAWDPDPSDTEYIVEMVYILRQKGCEVRVEHERHELGVFPEATWMRLLRDVGFDPRVEPCPYEGGEAARSFLGLRRLDK